MLLAAGAPATPFPTPAQQPMMGETVVAWSGGKDAAFALYELLEADITVQSLWTTINTATNRSSMHGVRRELYEAQATAIGRPLRVTTLPGRVDNERYRTLVGEDLVQLADEGAEQVAYGDIHLEGVRAFREDLLGEAGLTGCWPLWGRNEAALAHEVVEAGFEATVVAVDTAAVDPSVLGRSLAWVAESAPPEIDPAGEDGEFHTFVTDGPIFEQPVVVDHGRTVTREVGETTMAYLDLVPAGTDR